jgi:hypothetical protein
MDWRVGRKAGHYGAPYLVLPIRLSEEGCGAWLGGTQNIMQLVLPIPSKWRILA